MSCRQAVLSASVPTLLNACSGRPAERQVAAKPHDPAWSAPMRILATMRGAERAVADATERMRASNNPGY